MKTIRPKTATSVPLIVHTLPFGMKLSAGQVEHAGAVRDPGDADKERQGSDDGE